MSEALKPCPFCGGKVKSYTSPTSCAIRCEDCGGNYEAQKPPHYLDKIIAAWNRRSDSALAAEKSAREKAEAALAAKDARIADLSARLEETCQALEAMQEFHDCMEAQRKDEPLPEGHDDLDEACGAGTCYVVGAIITRGLEAAKRARLASPPPVAALKDKVVEAQEFLRRSVRAALDHDYSGCEVEHGHVMSPKDTMRSCLNAVDNALAALAAAQAQEKP